MAIERLIRAAHSGKEFPMFGDGRQVRDFTFVGDIARANAVAALVRLDPGEVFNVCSESPITLNDVIGIVEDVTGCSVRLERRRASIGDVDRTGGCSERIKAALGWQPTTSIVDGIRAQDQEVRRRMELVGAPS